AVETVANHLAQGAFEVGLFLITSVGFPGVDFLRQTERLENLLGEFLMVDAARTSLLNRLIKSCAEESNFHEVVEVPRLKRRILAIVGEAEKFSGVLL